MAGDDAGSPGHPSPASSGGPCPHETALARVRLTVETVQAAVASRRADVAAGSPSAAQLDWIAGLLDRIHGEAAA